MRNPATKDLFLYWNRLRAGRPAPLRTQIEPVDIRSHLADTFILEQGMRAEVTFRLAGTRVCAIYGRELKSYSFLNLFSLGDMGLIKRLVYSCFSDKNVSVITFDGITRERRVTSFEAIFMPLANSNENTRLFGAIFPMDKPYWLGAESVIESRITSVRVIDPDKELVSMTARPSIKVPPLALEDRHVSGPSALKAGTLEIGRRVGHLRVIAGGLEGS